MRHTSGNRRRLIARLLPLALLFAQFGAEVHAYSHLGADPDSLPNTAQTCAKCLSFSPLATAVGTAHHAAQFCPCDAERVISTAIASIPNPSPFSAFQPRAPPPLL